MMRPDAIGIRESEEVMTMMACRCFPNDRSDRFPGGGENRFPTWNKIYEHKEPPDLRGPPMHIDSNAVLAIATLITALSALVWAVRRKP
jgi:hypothetical protein